MIHDEEERRAAFVEKAYKRFNTALLMALVFLVGLPQWSSVWSALVVGGAALWAVFVATIETRR